VRPAVEAAWPAHARDFEGYCHWMYLDTFGNLTIGIGTLMEGDGRNPPTELLDLPWWRGDGSQAPVAEVSAEWYYVQTRDDLMHRGGGAYEEVTDLRLDAATVDMLLWKRTCPFWDRLVTHIPDLPNWPADAQLAMLDMGYNHGPNFLNVEGWLGFRDLVRQGNFTDMSIYIWHKSAHRRFGARAQLFANAAVVVQREMDPGVLWGSDVNLEGVLVAGWIFTVPHVARSVEEVEQRFGVVGNSYLGHDDVVMNTTKDAALAREYAADFWTLDKAVHDRVLAWFIDNARRIGATYIVTWGRVWSVARANEGVRVHSAANAVLEDGSPDKSARHTNHFHFSYDTDPPEDSMALTDADVAKIWNTKNVKDPRDNTGATLITPQDLLRWARLDAYIAKTNSIAIIASLTKILAEVDQSEEASDRLLASLATILTEVDQVEEITAQLGKPATSDPAVVSALEALVAALKGPAPTPPA
jgi:hypothetical protein